MLTSPRSTAHSRAHYRSRSTVARMTAALAAAVLALTGCGGTDTASPNPQPNTSATTGFPVSVQHKYGTTEIAAAPTRVVTLGLSDQDPVLALGVVPVGAIDWFLERPYGKWPWAQPLWAGKTPEIVGERDEYNLEKVAALKPDLIIGLYSGMSKDQYDKLAKIAPTVAQPVGFDDYAAPWQDMTRLAGKALGKEAKANELIAAIDARLAKLAAEHPDFAGKSVAVVEPYEPGKYAIFAPTDPKVVLLTKLGFTVPKAIVDAAGKEYAAEIGSEQLSSSRWTSWCSSPRTPIPSPPSRPTRCIRRSRSPRRTVRSSCRTRNRRSAPRCRSARS
ncbi:hypothetical protein GCM10027614_80050 [Micromonospora vulcania]